MWHAHDMPRGFQPQSLEGVGRSGAGFDEEYFWGKRRGAILRGV